VVSAGGAGRGGMVVRRRSRQHAIHGDIDSMLMARRYYFGGSMCRGQAHRIKRSAGDMSSRTARVDKVGCAVKSASENLPGHSWERTGSIKADYGARRTAGVEGGCERKRQAHCWAGGEGRGEKVGRWK